MPDDESPKKHVIDTEEPAPVATDIDPAMVGFIIVKARAFDVKVPPSELDPGSNAIDDDDSGVIEDDPSDLTETELADAIDQLSDDAAADLVALYWTGRGDYTQAEFKQARGMAIERGLSGIAAYLMGDPQLGDFLEEGLAALGYTPEDYAPG